MERKPVRPLDRQELPVTDSKSETHQEIETDTKSDPKSEANTADRESIPDVVSKLDSSRLWSQVVAESMTRSYSWEDRMALEGK